MLLDQQGYADLFAHLQQQGYRGTFKGWMAQMQAKSCSSQIRLFSELHLSRVGEECPELRRFVSRILALAAARFDQVRVNVDASAFSRCDAGIAFSVEGARRKSRRRGPLRLDGLDLNIEEREGYCTLYVSACVNTVLRRRRAFHFNKEVCLAD